MPFRNAWRFRRQQRRNRSSGRPEEDEDEIRINGFFALAKRTCRRRRKPSLLAASSPSRGGIQSLRPDIIEALAVGFGRPLSEPVEDTLRSVQSGVRHASNPVEAAARASAAFFRQELDEAIAHFLSDVVLAERLGWRRPLPLLALFRCSPGAAGGGRPSTTFAK